MSSETQKETQKIVENILSSLSGIEGLKQLFSELNYDVSNDELPRKLWESNIAQNALVDNPKIIATSKDFKIIYCRLDSDRLPLGMERPVVSSLLNQNPYSLFVFSDKNFQRWHRFFDFANYRTWLSPCFLCLAA